MAKRKIVWSSEASKDLNNILNFYLERNGTSAYSLKLKAIFNNNLLLIAKNPLMGVQTDYDSVRAFISGDYQIIYEILDQIILVVMIWDCRRNPDDKRIGQRIK